MAGAKPGVHIVQLKSIVVPETLQKGTKFAKWDDDSVLGVHIVLKVDPKGYFLYWTDINQDCEFLDISTIRDTRTGRAARVPKEGKMRDSVNMGPSEIALEDKTLTIVYGPDFVNVSFINFVCNSKELAKLWTDELLKMAYNLLALNQTAYKFLHKAWTKLSLSGSMDGKVAVKNIVKLFTQHKDDKKKVEKALELSGFPAGKNDAIPTEKFAFDSFFLLYRHLTNRSELDKIFQDIGAKKKPFLTVEQLVEFLNSSQRDPRLNEILYPFYTPARAQAIIDQYEPNKAFAQKGQLSVEGLLQYLLGEDNYIIAIEKFDLNEDMDQSFSHYFINSSHNTYLTGHQLTGKSSIEIYRQCLLAGCRCVELDCWDGKTSDEEPIITHGFTMCTDVLFRDVIEAIADSAFKTSDYPVILSFENHCSPKQQAKMAYYCRKYFGDSLLDDPLPSHPLEPNVPIPSPTQLIRKIIIKNKKKHSHKGLDATSSSSSKSPTLEKMGSKDSGTGPGEGGPEETPDASEEKVKIDSLADFVNGELESSDSEPESDDDLSGLTTEEEKARFNDSKEKGTAGKESEAGAEMSALVNYIQPVHFHSFEISEKRNRSYEISSFVETQATNLLKEQPVEFVNYNKRQLSRIYPKGTRVDSSNYMPQVFWNAGCQLVALNFQTLDLAMQLNRGIFEYNRQSGYLLKPEFMRRTNRRFDPFAESTVDGIVAGTLSIKIISAQFLSDKRISTFVEVDMYGLPADTVRKRFRTKTVLANGLNPIYDEEPFLFKKVVLPDLACIRITAYEESGKFIGHRVLPVVGLRPGYKHISLKNEAGQPLMLATLFVHISVKDYVPDGLSDFADALANPIAYLSQAEKHAKQLEALTDDFEVGDDDCTEEKEKENMQMKVKVQADARAREQGKETVNRPDSLGGEATREGSNKIKQLNKQESSISQQSGVSRGGSVVNKGTPCDNGSSQPAKSALDSAEVSRAEVLEQLKEHKLYLKCQQKQDKELEQLYKRHEKAKTSLIEIQAGKEEKLVQAFEKTKSALEKNHAKNLKKGQKGSGDTEELAKKNQEELNMLASEHEQKLKELRKYHAETIVNLFRDHFKAEMEIFEKYHEPVYKSLEQVMLMSQASQIKALESLHDKEVMELMTRLDAQTKEERKQLSKKHKDKDELSRMKREVQQKLIDQAVTERKKFNEVLERKKAELDAGHLAVRKAFEEEKAQARIHFKENFEKKCTNVMDEIKKDTIFGSSLNVQGEETKL